MLHIVLTILKVIGIILLVILGILLAVILLVLFVPLRYRLNVRRGNTPLTVDGRVTWLLHLLRIDLFYQEEQGSAEIRLLGRRLKTVHFPGEKAAEESPAGQAGSGDREAEAAEDGKPAELAAKEHAVEEHAAEEHAAEEHAAEEHPAEESTAAGAQQEAEGIGQTGQFSGAQQEAEGTGQTGRSAGVQQEAQETGQTAASKQEEGKEHSGGGKTKPSPDPGFVDRLAERLGKQFDRLLYLVLSLLRRIPELPAEFYDRIDGILEKIDTRSDKTFRMIDLILSAESEHMLEKGIRYLKYLMRGYAPRKISGSIHFGTGDPGITGKLTGLIFVLLPSSADTFEVIPDFYEEVLEIDASAVGQIRLYRAAWVGIRVLTDKEFWVLFRKIRGKEKKSGKDRKKKNHR